MLFVSPLDRIDSIHDHNSNPSKPVESMCAIGACFSPKKSIFVNAGQPGECWAYQIEINSALRACSAVCFTT